MEARLLGASCVIAFFASGFCTSASHAQTVYGHAAEGDSAHAPGRTGTFAFSCGGLRFSPSFGAVPESCWPARNKPGGRAVFNAQPTRLPLSNAGVDVYAPADGSAPLSDLNGEGESGVQSFLHGAVRGKDAVFDATEFIGKVVSPYRVSDSRIRAGDVPGPAGYAPRHPARLTVVTDPRRPVLSLVCWGLIGWLGIGRRKTV